MTHYPHHVASLAVGLMFLHSSMVTVIAADAPRFKPGSWLKLYALERGTKASVVQDGDPLFKTVDRSGDFQAANFRNRGGIELPKQTRVAAKWEGYLKIDRAGSHHFIVRPKSPNTTVIVLVNQERFLEATKINNPTTKSLDLGEGLHAVTLWVAANGGSEKAAASIQMKGPDETDFRHLTPGSFLYRED